MRLETPNKIRDLQRGLYLKAKRALACLEMKMIGKPYAGELHVRFDEGEQDFVFTADSKRARSWKRRTQPRIDLTNAEPVLYSTKCRPKSHRWARET